jgi:hypothetical protein
MSYQVGQAVIIYIDSADNGLFKLFMPHGNCNLMVFITGIEGSEILISDIDGTTGVVKSETQIKHLATEAEILAEAVKHGWKETNSKWLYTSPSGQLELMDIDVWIPLIKRQPLSDQFGFFGQECITAHRLITALNLAK